MTNDERDDANDSQALTGGDITKYRALVASVTCHKTDQISSLRQCKKVVRWQTHQCLTWNGSTGPECLFHWQQGGELEAYSDGDWGGDKSTPHCLKVWTKKQQVVSLSTAESELYAAVKTASEGLGIQSLAKDLGIVCKLNLHLGCVSNNVAGQPQEFGQGEARERATPVDTRSVQV